MVSAEKAKVKSLAEKRLQCASSTSGRAHVGEETSAGLAMTRVTDTGLKEHLRPGIRILEKEPADMLRADPKTGRKEKAKGRNLTAKPPVLKARPKVKKRQKGKRTKGMIRNAAFANISSGQS
jgi:hypothetical protein